MAEAKALSFIGDVAMNFLHGLVVLTISRLVRLFPFKFAAVIVMTGAD